MRGHQEGTISLFSYVSIEERIPAKHPLRRIRLLANEALKGLDRTFEQLYACSGRPSIPPEQLLRSLLLQAIYGLRSERLLLEQLDYNMLYRWFVGLGADDPIWHQTSFSKNRERLLNQKVLSLFLEKLLGMEEVKPLLSNDHFSVDGTLLQAWASHNSLKPVDGQQDSGQNNSTPPSPLHLPARLVRALARRRRLQEESRSSVPVETSMGSASATAPIAAALTLTPAWRAAAKPMPPCSASWVTSSWTTVTTWWWTAE